jgi:hypothetical protein
VTSPGLVSLKKRFAVHQALGVKLVRTFTGLIMVVPLLPGCIDVSSHDERLEENLDSLQITITLNPFDTYKPGQTDPGGGLRSLFLYHQDGVRLEPHAVWADGSPVSADSRVVRQDMLRIVRELGRLGLWGKAVPYYSEAVENPGGAVPTGRNYRAYRTAPPSCVIQAVYRSGDYHAYLVITLPWGDEAVEVLGRLKAYVPGPHVNSLISTIKEFPAT